MSILNIGLQNCALSREKASTELEYKCTSMKSIRSKHQEIGEELETSIEPVRRTMKNRIRKLALKDYRFQIMCPMQDKKKFYLSRHIDTMFPNMYKTKLVKKVTQIKVRNITIEWMFTVDWDTTISRSESVMTLSVVLHHRQFVIVYLIQCSMWMEITTKALKVHIERMTHLHWWKNPEKAEPAYAREKDQKNRHNYKFSTRGPSFTG